MRLFVEPVQPFFIRTCLMGARDRIVLTRKSVSAALMVLDQIAICPLVAFEALSFSQATMLETRHGEMWKVS